MSKRTRGEPLDDDVEVHITAGCPDCGKTSAHTHPHVEHRALVDAADPYRQARRGGPR